MIIALIITAVCLFVILLMVIVKFIHLKREIRRFSEEMEKLKDPDYKQPVKLTGFDKEITQLAVKINEHTEIQQNLTAEYENATHKLNNIISGISHDFRTPLTASLGYLQMIRKSGGLSETNKEYLDIAIEKNKYLRELSDEFFEISKPKSSVVETELQKINLSNLLSECILEQYGWIEQKKIIPEIQIQDGIIITSNSHYIIRIFDNLFSNASKYACSRLAVALKLTEGNLPTLTVSNDAADSAGIDTNKVFEPFYRGNSRSQGGSGLGLYVVKFLSQQLGFQTEAFFDKNGLFSVTVTFSEKN